MTDSVVPTGGAPVPFDDPNGVAAVRGSPVPDPTTRVSVVLEPRGVWRSGIVVLVLLAIALFLNFLLDDGGSVIFTVLIAWFASIAMEPAVSRLSQRMKRGAATILVMLGVALFCILFGIAFGRLIADQLIQAVKAIPAFANQALDWVNGHLGTDYSPTEALGKIGITQETLTEWAKQLAGGVLGFVVSVLGAIFSSFTFLLFTFYFSADAPRLQALDRPPLPDPGTRRSSSACGTWRSEDRRLRRGPRRARRHLRHDHGAVPAHHRDAVLAGPRHLDRCRRAVRADHRHVRRDPAAGLVGLIGPDPLKGVLALIFADRLPADREPHHRAADQRGRGRHAPGGVVRRRAARGGAVRCGRRRSSPSRSRRLLLALLDIYTRTYELLPSLRPGRGAPTGTAAARGEGAATRAALGQGPAPSRRARRARRRRVPTRHAGGPRRLPCPRTAVTPSRHGRGRLRPAHPGQQLAAAARAGLGEHALEVVLDRVLGHRQRPRGPRVSRPPASATTSSASRPVSPNARTRRSLRSVADAGAIVTAMSYGVPAAPSTRSARTVTSRPPGQVRPGPRRMVVDPRLAGEQLGRDVVRDGRYRRCLRRTRDELPQVVRRLRGLRVDVEGVGQQEDDRAVRLALCRGGATVTTAAATQRRSAGVMRSVTWARNATSSASSSAAAPARRRGSRKPQRPVPVPVHA